MFVHKSPRVSLGAALSLCVSHKCPGSPDPSSVEPTTFTPASRHETLPQLICISFITHRFESFHLSLVIVFFLIFVFLFHQFENS